MKRLDLLLLVAIGLSLGITFGIFLPSQFFDATAILVLCVIACGFSFFGKPFFVSVMTLLLSLIGGLLLGSIEFQYWQNLSESEETFRGTAVVTESSVRKSFFQESEILAEGCDSNFCPKEKILLRESEGGQRTVGDRMMLLCDLKRPEEYIERGGLLVAYRMILAARGIGHLCERPVSITKQERNEGWRFVMERMLSSGKERIRVAIERSVPATEAALSLGMLIGADDGFSSVEKDIFIRTGVTHVTAVSGYNITLVGGLLFFLAIFLGWYRKGASYIAIAGIILYVIFVGAPASAVRAGIMGSLLLFALALGHPGSAFRIWVLAFAGMLVWNPLLIRYDIGFELSYIATLALLLYASVREMLWMPRNIVTRFFFELMMLSLFVEWLVAPIILLQFGTFSVVSIIANVFLVPLVPVIMFFSFLSGLTGIIMSGGIFLFTWPNFFFAHLFLVGTEALSSLPMSFLSDLLVSPWWVVLWYIVSGYLFWFLLWRKRNGVECGISSDEY